MKKPSLSLFSPVFIAEYNLHRQIAKALDKVIKLDQVREKWLDYGCGTCPYKHLFSGRAEYIGIDVEVSGRDKTLKAAHYYYDGQRIPEKDGTFDGVLSTQVLEHVVNPETYLLEAFRVLKPGGHLILSAPFVYQEHEQPYDFYRFSSFQIIKLLTQVGFEVDKCSKTTCGLEAISQLLSVWCLSNLRPPIKGGGLLVSLLLCFPIQMFGIFLQKIFPDSGELFLDVVVIAKKNIFWS